jgi:hypothetical protein
MYDVEAVCEVDDGATMQRPNGAKMPTDGACWHLVSVGAKVAVSKA